MKSRCYCKKENHSICYRCGKCSNAAAFTISADRTVKRAYIAELDCCASPYCTRRGPLRQTWKVDKLSSILLARLSDAYRRRYTFRSMVVLFFRKRLYPRCQESRSLALTADPELPDGAT